jgi:hypothetical protein
MLLAMTAHAQPDSGVSPPPPAADPRAPLAAAFVHGYSRAAGWAAVVLLVAAIAVGLLVTAGPPPQRE